MKTFHFAVLAALVSLCSCQKDPIKTAFSPEDGSEPVEISVNIASKGMTRAAGADELKVNSLQVFVFRTDAAFAGKREAYASVSASTADLKITTGPRRIYALVNAPSLSSVATEEAFLAAKSQLVDNSEGSLVMLGSTGATAVNVSPTNHTFTIEVAHICAKIALGTVKVNFDDVSYAGKTFEVTRAYLANVAGETNYSLSATPSATTYWYNQNIASANPIAAAKATLIQEDFTGKSVTITSGSDSNISLARAYYAYPNTAAKLNSSSWAPQQTKLVIEAKVDGIACAYPVSLGNLARNTSYAVNLTVHRLGVDPDNPWEDVEVNTCTITVSPVDWVAGAAVSEEI